MNSVLQSAEDEIRSHVALSYGLERKHGRDIKEPENSQHDDESIREHTLDDRRETCARSGTMERLVPFRTVARAFVTKSDISETNSRCSETKANTYCHPPKSLCKEIPTRHDSKLCKV